MEQTERADDRRVLTIGHSNHTLEFFLSLVNQHRIEVLVDVRSHPRSGYSPHFDRPTLEVTLRGTGVRYLFLGEELGGRPKDGRYYDETGRVRYDLVAGTDSFRAGINRIEKGAGTFRVGIMCSEENPTDCHRRLLVGRVLESDGIHVEHVRGDGTIISETDLREAEQPSVVQDSLFGPKPEEGKPWRSIRPVSRSGQRQASSEA